MDKKIIIGVVVVVLAGAFFYSGMVYGEQKSKGKGNGAGQDRQAQFQRFVGQSENGGVGGQVRMRGNGNGGFTAGEILSKDENSITIKLRDGGSKIILLSGSTQVMKEAQGSANDLSTGAWVSVAGEANPDGSVNAQSVQIRPSAPTNPLGKQKVN